MKRCTSRRTDGRRPRQSFWSATLVQHRVAGRLMAELHGNRSQNGIEALLSEPADSATSRRLAVSSQLSRWSCPHKSERTFAPTTDRHRLDDEEKIDRHFRERSACCNACDWHRIYPPLARVRPHLLFAAPDRQRRRDRRKIG